MRTLSYYVASTLDGYISEPGDNFERFVMEGEHVDDFLASLRNFDAVLMGTATYDVGYRAGVINPYPGLHKYIFSRSLPDITHEEVDVVRTDAADFVRDLKTQPGRSIWLCGGAKLATSLLAARLIDEIVLKLHPRLFGQGTPLFASPARSRRWTSPNRKFSRQA